MDEKLASSSRIKGACERALKKWKEEKEKKPEMDSNLKTAQNGSFATVANTNEANHSLYRCWILDTGSDTHVINHYEGLTNVREAPESSVLNGGRDTYRIEAYGDAKVNLTTPDGPSTITLLNVAYVPGYLTNIVAMGRLSRGGVHWSSSTPDILTYGGEVFANLEAVGQHWVLQSALEFQHSAYATTENRRRDKHTKKSADLSEKAISMELAHKILAHPSPEVMEHVQEAVTDVIIDNSPLPTSINCVTCAKSKAIHIVSRKTGNEEEFPEAEAVFAYDIIYKKEAYNGDMFCSHLQDLYTGFNFVYSHKKLGDSLSILERAFKEIRNLYGYRPKVIHLDGERTLQLQYEALIGKLGIREKRSAPETHEQPKSERAGRMLTIKARSLMIEANMPDSMWNEAYKTAGYIANRTPTKRLGWRTPFEMFTKSVPAMAHMHPFGCRAYPLIHKIKKLDKMNPRHTVPT